MGVTPATTCKAVGLTANRCRSKNFAQVPNVMPCQNRGASACRTLAMAVGFDDLAVCDLVWLFMDESVWEIDFEDFLIASNRKPKQSRKSA